MIYFYLQQTLVWLLEPFILHIPINLVLAVAIVDKSVFLLNGVLNGIQQVYFKLLFREIRVTQVPNYTNVTIMTHNQALYSSPEKFLKL